VRLEGGGRGWNYEKRNMEIRHSDDTGCADSHCYQLRCYQLHELKKSSLTPDPSPVRAGGKREKAPNGAFFSLEAV